MGQGVGSAVARAGIGAYGPQLGVVAAVVVLCGLLTLGVAPRLADAVGVGPLIVGNNAAAGGGEIDTWDASGSSSPVAGFVPDGASGTNSGMGVAISGNEVFYTELTDGNGPSDVIHVAPFNGGLGGADTRSIPNPDRATGIAALAYSEGVLYALSGYGGSGSPAVYGLNPSTGAVVSGPIDLGSPAAADSDGFTVLPSGRFLVNTGAGSCTYAEFNATTGVATGSSFTLAASVCTGVETDGSTLYFVTDGDSFTRTSLSGSVLKSIVADVSTVQDIALIRIVEDGPTITGLDPVHVWLGLRNSDDQGTQFDARAELLVNGDTVVATALKRCITGVTRNPASAKEAVLLWDALDSVPLAADDIVQIRLSTRIGTTIGGARCSGPGGSHASATGLRLYYDAASRPSRFGWTKEPGGSSDEWLHSDGTACGGAQSAGVTARWFDETAPVGWAPKCRDSAGVTWAGGNPWKVIGTWGYVPAS